MLEINWHALSRTIAAPFSSILPLSMSEKVNYSVTLETKSVTLESLKGCTNNILHNSFTTRQGRAGTPVSKPLDILNEAALLEPSPKYTTEKFNWTYKKIAPRISYELIYIYITIAIISIISGSRQWELGLAARYNDHHWLAGDLSLIIVDFVVTTGLGVINMWGVESSFISKWAIQYPYKYILVNK